jgi:RNA polymerase sigma-70 factor (ECF subfamily)
MTSGTDPSSLDDDLTPAAVDAALRELHDMHGPVLLNYLVRVTQGDRYRAEDILQETLIRAWRHPQARGADGSWSRAWLFTVARRIAIDHMRAAQTRPTEVGDDRLDERPEEDSAVERLVDIAEVRAAVACLPDRLRDVLVEIYFRERSVAEAADILGVPAGTIKSRTFYALRALSDALRAKGPRATLKFHRGAAVAENCTETRTEPFNSPTVKNLMSPSARSLLPTTVCGPPAAVPRTTG